MKVKRMSQTPAEVAEEENLKATVEKQKQIIRKLWSAIYDLLLYIQKDPKRKPLDEIEDNLDLLERVCRKYENIDDEEENT